MTVTVLTQQQKDTLIKAYQNGTHTIKQIANFLNVSNRTVVRVLNQAGILTKKQKEEADLRAGARPSLEKVVKFCAEMPESAWASLLADIVTARVAKAHNTHVQTAMLNIQNKVNNNAG